MNTKKINLNKKFNKISDYWSPKVIAEMNDYQFKLAKVKDEFIWHKHDNTDETFIVINGTLTIEFKTETVMLGPGEMIVLKPQVTTVEDLHARTCTIDGTYGYVTAQGTATITCQVAAILNDVA